MKPAETFMDSKNRTILVPFSGGFHFDYEECLAPPPFSFLASFLVALASFANFYSK